MTREEIQNILATTKLHKGQRITDANYPKLLDALELVLCQRDEWIENYGGVPRSEVDELDAAVRRLLAAK